MLLDFISKVKTWCSGNKADLCTALIIFLVGIGGFGFGRLSMLWIPKEPITITDNNPAPEKAAPTLEMRQKQTDNSNSPILNASGKFIGSKSGTTYHFPWCPGAQKVSEGNKIWFQTREEAESRGYKPAGNCPGL